MDFRFELVKDVWYMVVLDDVWGNEIWFKSVEPPEQ